MIEDRPGVWWPSSTTDPPPPPPDPRPGYEPTPEEIREACEKIRAEWSAWEEQQRLRPDWRRGRVTADRARFGDGVREPREPDGH